MNKRSVDLTGPWDVPLRKFNNSFLLKVSIIKPSLTDTEEDKVIDEKVIDYGEYEDRKFLGRISFWAWTNNYIVETTALEKA